MRQIGIVLALAILAAAFEVTASAQDLRITLPKRSHPTPVQKLNQDGVKAVNKHDYKKAERLFYKAYLIDPDDPFTLNNLGYISELQGKVDRALRYYELAARQNSDTTIAESSIKDLKGKPLTAVTTTFADRDLRVNRGNVEAMNLLQRGRPGEAENILRQTLELNPRNAFTLNNLGYTMEAEGDLNAAREFYTQAANQRSDEKTIVAPDPHWRGKPISEVADRNARAVAKRIESEQSIPAQVARLNLQGVSALNHNHADKARGFFEQAYKLDPNNAFALNNMGYVAEMNGDQETAQELYREAKSAPGAGAKVTVATRREFVGAPLAQVANTNDQATEASLAAQQEERRRQAGPIQLRRRDNTLVPIDGNSPSTATPNQPSSPALSDQPPSASMNPVQPAAPTTAPPQSAVPPSSKAEPPQSTPPQQSTTPPPQ